MLWCSRSCILLCKETLLSLFFYFFKCFLVFNWWCLKPICGFLLFDIYSFAFGIHLIRQFIGFVFRRCAFAHDFGRNLQYNNIYVYLQMGICYGKCDSLFRELRLRPVRINPEGIQANHQGRQQIDSDHSQVVLGEPMQYLSQMWKTNLISLIL